MPIQPIIVEGGGALHPKNLARTSRCRSLGSAVPRTKLKALYSVLFRSPLEAQFEGLRIQERLKALWPRWTDALEGLEPMTMEEDGRDP